MARKKHELEVTNKRTYTRSQMYPISHKKQDGSYVNDEAREKSEKLATLESEGAPSQHSSQDDAISKLFGKEHSGRVRGMGFGVCSSQVFYSSSGRCGGITHSCSHSSDSAKIQQMEVEMKEGKAAVSVLQAQLNYFVTHYMGGVLPPDFPTVADNVVGDMKSPVQARPSSNASHEPETIQHLALTCYLGYVT